MNTRSAPSRPWWWYILHFSSTWLLQFSNFGAPLLLDALLEERPLLTAFPPLLYFQFGVSNVVIMAGTHKLLLLFFHSTFSLFRLLQLGTQVPRHQLSKCNPQDDILRVCCRFNSFPTSSDWVSSPTTYAGSLVYSPHPRLIPVYNFTHTARTACSSLREPNYRTSRTQLPPAVTPLKLIFRRASCTPQKSSPSSLFWPSSLFRWVSSI